MPVNSRRTDPPDTIAPSDGTVAATDDNSLAALSGCNHSFIIHPLFGINNWLFASRHSRAILDQTLLSDVVLFVESLGRPLSMQRSASV